MNTEQDYYNDTREVEWEKFDEEIINLSLQLIQEEFSDIERIPNGVSFGQAYTFKTASGKDPAYGLKTGESAAILEYDKSRPEYDEKFVEKFTETFTGSGKEIDRKLEENFNALLR